MRVRNSQKVSRSRKKKISPKTKRALQDIADADWYLIASRTEELMSDLHIDGGESLQAPTFQLTETATVPEEADTTPNLNSATNSKHLTKQTRNPKRRGSHDPRRRQARFPSLNKSPIVEKDKKKALSLKDVWYFLLVIACDGCTHQLTDATAFGMLIFEFCHRDCEHNCNKVNLP